MSEKDVPRINLSDLRRSFRDFDDIKFRVEQKMMNEDPKLRENVEEIRDWALDLLEILKEK